MTIRFIAINSTSRLDTIGQPTTVSVIDLTSGITATEGIGVRTVDLRTFPITHVRLHPAVFNGGTIRVPIITLALRARITWTLPMAQEGTENPTTCDRSSSIPLGIVDGPTDRPLFTLDRRFMSALACALADRE